MATSKKSSNSDKLQNTAYKVNNTRAKNKAKKLLRTRKAQPNNTQLFE